MFFQEVFRIWDNHRHRSNPSPSCIARARIQFTTSLPKLPRLFSFHAIGGPSLPRIITDTKAYRAFRKVLKRMSSNLSSTRSNSSARMMRYMDRRRTSWAPHAPSFAVSEEVHKLAALVTFCSMTLAWAFIAGCTATATAMIVGACWNHLWPFCLYLVAAGWLPGMILGFCYKYGKWRIKVRQRESWETWAATSERRLREFEGLYGDERILAEESFNEWTLNGEGEDGWYFGERELEEQRTPFYEDDILAEESFNGWTLNGEGGDGWYFGERDLEEQRTPFYEDDILAADLVIRSSRWSSAVDPADARSEAGENMSLDSRLTTPMYSSYSGMTVGSTGADILTQGEYEMEQLAERPAAEMQDNMDEIRVAGEEVTVRAT